MQGPAVAAFVLQLAKLQQLTASELYVFPSDPRTCCAANSMQTSLAFAALLVVSAAAQLSDDLSREQLKPLTAFRQQHRRLVLKIDVER